MPKSRRLPNRERLSDRAIRSIPPDFAGRIIIWDTVQRGLAFVLHPTGRRAFKVVYQHAGRSRWYHVGDASIGVANARKIAGRILYQVAEGRDPQAEKMSDRRAGTFAELAADYREQWAKKRNRSWRQAAGLVDKHLLPRWGHLRAKEISRAHVRILIEAIEAPTVGNQVLAAASAIFTWAVNREIVSHNVCRGVERRPTTSRARVLADSEIALTWPRLDPALKLILLTGQRPGEVAHMRRSDIVDGWWCMSGSSTADGSWMGTKNSRDHRVWLSEPALALVDVHIVDRKHRRSQDLLRRLCIEHGLEHARPHDLRRTCLTLVTRLGHGRDAMDRIANHKDGRVRDVYDRHTYAREDAMIMDAVGRYIVGVVSGTAATNVVRLR